MKKCYHMTSLDKVRTISNSGLVPKKEDNNRIINTQNPKVFYSEGMTGTISSYARTQNRYDEIKAGTSKNEIANSKSEKIKSSENLEDFLGQGVVFVFDGSEVENERNFMDGCTEQKIAPEALQVCLLKNSETNEVSFSRADVIHYMMSKVPVESIKYSGFDKNPTQIDDETAKIQKQVSSYIKGHEKEINKYKYGNYTLENMSVREFCEQYLSEKESKVTGQTIGKAVEPELQNVRALSECERSLDILLNRSRDEQEQTVGKEVEKIREKKENQ